MNTLKRFPESWRGGVRQGTVIELGAAQSTASAEVLCLSSRPWVARLTATARLPVYTSSMPSKHDHPKYGGRRAGTPNKPEPSLLALLNERFPDFHPVRTMEEMYNDPETPPELKVRLQREIAAYTRAAVKSRLFLPALAGKEQGHNEPGRPYKALDV
jgi:hypothetical protein